MFSTPFKGKNFRGKGIGSEERREGAKEGIKENGEEVCWKESKNRNKKEKENKSKARENVHVKEKEGEEDRLREREGEKGRLSWRAMEEGTERKSKKSLILVRKSPYSGNLCF